jgi:hypothetical protein
MNSNNYNIKKHENEIDLYFNVRKIFVQLLKPKNDKQYKLYEAYSNMFINILFLKCRYNEKNEKFIVNFLKKFKTKLKKAINIELNVNLL